MSSVCLSACLSVCLPACLPACLAACLSVSACLPAFVLFLLICASGLIFFHQWWLDCIVNVVSFYICPGISSIDCFESSCYIVEPFTSVNWGTADTYCKDKEGRLVSVETPDEQDYIRSLVYALTGE